MNNNTLQTLLQQWRAAPPFVDVHTHARNRRDDVVSIGNIRFDIDGLPAGDEGFFSVGIHPWDSGHIGLPDGFAAAADGAQAIGECGLDKCSAADMAAQVETFIRQIDLAERIGKPMIIHCVRAYGRLLELRHGRQMPWIIHGCYASTEWIAQAAKTGCYFSVGTAQMALPKCRRMVEAIPPDRLLLETDDVPSADIGDTYAAACEILGIGLDKLKLQVWKNFRRVFIPI